MIPYSTNNLLLKRCMKHPVRNDYIMYIHNNLSGYTKLCSLYKLLTHPLQDLRQSEWHQSMYSGQREASEPSHSVRSGRSSSYSVLELAKTNILSRCQRSDSIGTKPQTSYLGQFISTCLTMNCTLIWDFPSCPWNGYQGMNRVTLILLCGLLELQYCPQQLCQTSQFSAELPVEKQQENWSTYYWQPVLDFVSFFLLWHLLCRLWARKLDSKCTRGFLHHNHQKTGKLNYRKANTGEGLCIPFMKNSL